MLRALVVIGIAFAAALGAPPGLALAGNGLYDPFPQKEGQTAEQSYYEELGVPLHAEQIRRGVARGSLAPGAVFGAASRRAGKGHPSLGIGGLLGGLAVVVLALGAPAGWAWRRSGSLRGRPGPA